MSLWEEIAKARAQLKHATTIRYSGTNQEASKAKKVVAAYEGNKNQADLSENDSKEISLGTVASPSMSAFTVLTQEHAEQERTIKERLWWIEWVLGFAPDKQQMARVRYYWAEYGANAPYRKQPYLDYGIPMLPYLVEPKYRYWEDGQPLLDTLLELGASDSMIDCRVTRERSPDDWRRWQEIKAKRRK
jgi:hypothetical protein